MSAVLSADRWTDDERATARLLFAPELADGTVDEDDVLGTAEVFAAVRRRAVPGAPRRLAQALSRKAGRFDPFTRHTLPAVRARRAVLGDRAAGPPRVLLRMDEYPHWLAAREPQAHGDDAFAPWAEILAGVPHLVAVVPHPAENPERREGPARDLTDTEVERLHRLAAAGATFGLHGWEHRTTFARPRRHTEFAHLPAPALGALLDRARERLATRAALDTSVLVPPFNTFRAAQWTTMAARFPVVTGGPESVLRIGAIPPATFLAGSVYLPAYPPLYGTAAQVLPEVERHLEARTGLWTPIVLHWGWEAADGWRDLERLIERIAPYATPWETFTDAVEKSR